MIDQITANFSFTALWSPLYMVVIALVIVGYFLLIGKYRYKFKDATKVPVRKQISFVFGMVTFYLGFGGPFYLVAHILFSAHMIQMALVYLIAPPLIIAGLPAWLLRAFINLKYIKKPFRLFSNPIVALVLFNGMFSIYHIPAVYDFFMTNYVLHITYISILFVAAFFMWWPIICPVPELDTLIGLKKLAYILGNGVLLTPACGLIIFAGHTLYDTYMDPKMWATALGFCLPSTATVSPELFNTFRPADPIDDQQFGGVLMKILQEIVFGFAYGYTFIQWFRKERSENTDLSMNPPHLQPKRT